MRKAPRHLSDDFELADLADARNARWLDKRKFPLTEQYGCLEPVGSPLETVELEKVGNGWPCFL